jgi:metallo-beta-lactamase class B
MQKLALLLCASFAAQAQYVAAEPRWTQPAEPFRIADDLYYVGTANVPSFLIETSDGLILLDTGVREVAPALEANIRKLGFRIEDVKLLLISHGHFDHIGGLAAAKARTKARLLVSPAEAPLIARGGKDDFAFGDTVAYPPVEADGLLKDGEPVRLGGTALTPHFTPGHTKGSVTWTMTLGKRRVVFAGSMSAPGYKLVGNAKYPEIVRDYRASFARLRALPCDIFLGFHGWDFGMEQKRGGDFVDPEGYRRYIDRTEAAFEKQLKEQGGR